ncbi:hypothetical protein Cni_G06279 [Canna indica]|uniref:Uncharacterized protein n=1 Tax=Canna indica TaxID=4628 RepID=A0AAQ3JZZ0_9LILI|nr:hypothetical protein Cni_G06279 [Canna indica]
MAVLHHLISLQSEEVVDYFYSLQPEEDDDMEVVEYLCPLQSEEEQEDSPPVWDTYEDETDQQVNLFFEEGEGIKEKLSKSSEETVLTDSVFPMTESAVIPTIYSVDNNRWLTKFQNFIIADEPKTKIVPRRISLIEDPEDQEMKNRLKSEEVVDYFYSLQPEEDDDMEVVEYLCPLQSEEEQEDSPPVWDTYEDETDQQVNLFFEEGEGIKEKLSKSSEETVLTDSVFPMTESAVIPTIYSVDNNRWLTKFQNFIIADEPKTKIVPRRISLIEDPEDQEMKNRLKINEGGGGRKLAFS